MVVRSGQWCNIESGQNTPVPVGWGLLVLDLPGLQHAVSLVRLWVLIIWPWIDPLDSLRKSHEQQEQRTLGLRSSELGSVLKAVVQGPIRLANVGVGAFGTLDAVHYSLPVVLMNLIVVLYCCECFAEMRLGKQLWASLFDNTRGGEGPMLHFHCSPLVCSSEFLQLKLSVSKCSCGCCVDVEGLGHLYVIECTLPTIVWSLKS